MPVLPEMGRAVEDPRHILVSAVVLLADTALSVVPANSADTGVRDGAATDIACVTADRVGRDNYGRHRAAQAIEHAVQRDFVLRYDSWGGQPLGPSAITAIHATVSSSVAASM